MKRKLIAFMAAALALLSVFPTSAFAADEDHSIVIDALCDHLPEIRVTVPSTGNVYLNPYKLAITIGGEDGEEVDDQVVSEPGSIENRSEVPLSVDVTIVGRVNEGSNMGLRTISTTGSGLTSKKAFIYFEMQAVEDPDDVEWDSGYDSTKHLVVRTSTKTKKQMLTLDRADKENRYGAFRLAGDCVAAPKKPWEDGDGFEVSIAFTFTPLPYDYS